MKHILYLAIAASIITSSNAGASLISRLGGEAVYDTAHDITWLANANLSKTNHFGVSPIISEGYMSWDTANNWIAAMNAADYLGYSDWRLPRSLQPDSNCTWNISGKSYGPNCTGSEMGHLFYDELSGVENNTIQATHNEYFDLFQGIRNIYWTGTESVGNPDVYAWQFNFADGFQDHRFKSQYRYVWAVRDGDVITPLPLPPSIWLMIASLTGLFVTSRRRKRKN